MSHHLFSRFSIVRALWSDHNEQRPNQRGAKTQRNRRLGFELCEARELLAGASIAGIKFDTANSSGFSSGDKPQSGVVIDLYKDKGDGIFNPATDMLVNQQITQPVTGAFTFSNVADGLYYIQEEVPTGYAQSAGPAFYTVDVIGGQVYTGSAQTIDNFTDPTPETDFFINAINPNPFPLPPQPGPTSDIIGGWRDLTVAVLGPSNPISAAGFVGTVGTSDGVFNLNSSSTGPGTEVTMQYNANGAGLATNLTAASNNGIRVDFDFLQVGVGTTMDVEALITGPGGTATLPMTNITQNPGGFSVFVPFSSFSKTGSFSFSNVTSIQFSFNSLGVVDADYEITKISGVDQQSSGYNFGNFPIPSSLAGFVYVDANNNGNKDVGEPPISGTIITLTGTNDLGQSVTQTTTTNASGAYVFSNLRPGVYKLSETHPINFIDGKDTIGTPGGTTTNDMFSNINLPAGFSGVNNNFGELGLTPAYASKRTLVSPAPPVNLSAVYTAAATPPVATSAAIAKPAVITSTPPTVVSTPKAPVVASTWPQSKRWLSPLPSRPW